MSFRRLTEQKHVLFVFVFVSKKDERNYGQKSVFNDSVLICIFQMKKANVLFI